MNAKKSLLFVSIGMVIALVIALPKIYLRNNIYYVSKDINRLTTRYISLNEENKFLKQQHEDAQFKNQIMDSLLLQNIDNK